jgi:hypothetical protein
MLTEEFARANRPFSVEGRRILDAQRIFFRNEPRDLSAALRYYCGDSHDNSHDALGDVLATIRVLDGQFRKYPDLPDDMDALNEYCDPRDPSWVDRAGRLKWAKGEVVFNFGKFQGQSLRDAVVNDPNFITWLLRSDFPDDTKQIVRDAVNGKYPGTAAPPPPAPPRLNTEKAARNRGGLFFALADGDPVVHHALDGQLGAQALAHLGLDAVLERHHGVRAGMARPVQRRFTVLPSMETNSTSPPCPWIRGRISSMNCSTFSCMAPFLR